MINKMEQLKEEFEALKERKNELFVEIRQIDDELSEIALKVEELEDKAPKELREKLSELDEYKLSLEDELYFIGIDLLELARKVNDLEE